MKPAGSRMTNSRRTNQGCRAMGIPPQRYYTLLTVEPTDPFGFGSQAPARPETQFPDIPGPGKYDPRMVDSRVMSTRGCGTGFTSGLRRRLEFVTGTKNPAPCTYDAQRTESRLKPKIRGVFGQRCACFPDERMSSLTPGPGSYDVSPPKNTRAVTSVFRSRSSRELPYGAVKQEPRFNGRTFILGRGDM
jgi:hypothetical protein